MKELLEMIQILLEMQTDTYLMCKYVLLAVSHERRETEMFFKELFNLTDKKRPPLIEIKKGSAV